MRCESARRERVCAGRAPPCGEACGGALRRDPCAFWDRFTGGSERESGLEAVAVCGPPGLNAMTGRIHHAQAARPVVVADLTDLGATTAVARNLLLMFDRIPAFLPFYQNPCLFTLWY